MTAEPTLDPTRIDIQFDPTVQRMRGVATHGLTPFDVPFISHIEGNLYQGGTRQGLVMPTHIEHFVSLYQWESYWIGHELKSSTTVKMYDSLEQGFEQVDELAAHVLECMADGPTLVVCQAGLNRSSLVAARALMLGGRTADEAISLLREKRSPACLCNPSFEEWLRNL